MEVGSIADWVMALITALGFAGAVIQLRSNLADSRAAREQARLDVESEREAMARAVGVKSDWLPGPEHGPADQGRDPVVPVRVEIMNAGPYPIRTALLQLVTDDVPRGIVLGTILPGKHLKETYEVTRSEIVFGELTGGATLFFTDTYGQSWSSSTSWEGLQRRDHEAHIC